MNLLAISGSVRAASSNSLLLNSLKRFAPATINISVFEGIETLPIFNPDLEGCRTPDSVLKFCRQIEAADGVLIACPEYVRSIPGGLKNVIDWLVSRQEIINKPIALAHASGRGDDMLIALRTVLATVSDGFSEDLFLRIPLNSKSPAQAESTLTEVRNKALIREFMTTFGAFIEARRDTRRIKPGISYL